MGQESIVYGYINAINNLPPGNEELYRLNEKILQALPEEDTYPWITKWMFSTVPVNTQHIYRNQVIHFGASYKGVESDWKIWIEKFEDILKQLHWFDATVHLVTENFGQHTYSWIMKIEDYDSNTIHPTTSWNFSGGKMLFEL